MRSRRQPFAVCSYNFAMFRISAPKKKPVSGPDATTETPAEAQIERDTSIDGIARQLTDAIAARQLPPGTWLREEALGRVYGVSRTKVRAALLVLSKDKLIEMVPDKGAFVCRPTVTEAREVFAMRRLLESEVVRLFVARGKPADYAALKKHVRIEREMQHGGAAGNLQERLLGDFHVVLAVAAGNTVLADLVRELVGRSSLITMLYDTENDQACSSDEHEGFLKIARNGQTEAAVGYMIEHLNRVEASLHLSAEPVPRSLDLVKALLQ
jgi:DNA-binding GntR family transcriptional regulator